MLLSALGVLIILAGIATQITQLVVSIRTRAARCDVTGDPWDGRSLEWATHSPPPVFNFAKLPNVSEQEPYWDVKQQAREAMQLVTPEPDYEPIEMPRNTPTGFITAFFATLTGFALIWHIWWMVILGLIGAYVTFVVFAWRDRTEYVIPVEEVARMDHANREARAKHLRELAR
jgi:cytochrome o ubiquinol oxidase subunit 1